MLGQLDELQVHLPDLGKVSGSDHHLDMDSFLNPLKNVEPLPAPVALEGIRGIGDVLQFVEDELGNEENSVEKPSFAHIRDAAVDDHAGVENLAGRRLGGSRASRAK